MGSKRKLESPLTSEPSPKIRRVRSANSELEETQDEPSMFPFFPLDQCLSCLTSPLYSHF